MKQILVFLISVMILVACGSSKKLSGGGTSMSGGDGSSMANAIIIKATSEGPGVAAEYDWLKQHYPGYKMMEQKLLNNGSKSYDELDFKTADGVKKSVYFDISNFFGKM